jgi:hypothetical protein
MDTALQIASAYRKLGNLYIEKGTVKESVINYRKSIKYFDGCHKKTDKEDYLNKILINLQEIEIELSKIKSDKAEPALETQRKSLRIPQ